MKISMCVVLLVMISLMMPATLALEISVDDYDPKPAEAGQFVNVWVSIENTNNVDASGVYVEITPRDGLSLAPGESVRQTIGLLPAFGYKVVNYRLFVADDAPDGSNMVEVLAADSSGAFTKDFSLQVTEKDLLDVDLAIGQVESDPTRVKPDDESVKLDVTILNIGDGTARAVTAEIKNVPDGVSFSESYSNSALIGNIEGDGLAKATFYIDIDEEMLSGEYEADLLLTYKYKPYDSESEYVFDEVTLPLRLSIKPIPRYKIPEMKLTPAQLTAGDKGVQMALKIVNIGEDEGESVRVKVYEKTEHPFSFEVSSNFVAPSLAPGEDAWATLEFDVDKDAHVQEYLLDVEIRNIVDGDVITYSHKVPVSVSFAAKNDPWTPIIIVVLVVVAIVLVVFFVRRGGKKPSRPARKLKHSYEKKYLDD